MQTPDLVTNNQYENTKKWSSFRMSYMSDENYVSRIVEIFILARVDHLSVKTQFGGCAVYTGKTMFAILLKNTTYLRLSREDARNFLNQDHDGVIDMRGGYPKVNGFYEIPENILSTTSMMEKLSSVSIALSKKLRDAGNNTNSIRIKDQANMNYGYEKQFLRIGIDTVEQLREIGAKEAYIRLSKTNKKPQFITLLKIEGAIQGKHIAVLDIETIQEYRNWWNSEFKKHGNES